MTKKGAIIVSVINFDMYEIWKCKIFFWNSKEAKKCNFENFQALKLHFGKFQTHKNVKILQKLKSKASKILKKAILDTSNLQKLFSRKFWVAENPKFPHWVSWQHWPLLQLTYFVHNQVRRNQPHIGNVLGHIGLFRYIPWGNFGLILQTLELRMRLLERPCHHCTRIKTNGPVPYSSLQIGLQWAEIQWRCIT